MSNKKINKFSSAYLLCLPTLLLLLLLLRDTREQIYLLGNCLKSFLFHSDIHSQQFPTTYNSWLLILIWGSLGSLWHQLSREGTRIWFLKPSSSVWWIDKAGFFWKSWCFPLCPLIRPKEVFANILSLVFYALALAHFCPRCVGMVKYKIRENKQQHSWEASNNYFC